MQTNNPKQNKFIHLLKPRTILMAVGVIIVLAGLGYFGMTTHGPVHENYQNRSVRVTSAVSVDFSQKLLQFDTKKITIMPHVDGKWQIQRSLFGGDKLTFSHAEPLIAGTTYTVNFGSVKRFSGLSVAVPKLSFTTEFAPGIEQISFKNNQVLAADAQLSLTLSGQNNKLRNLELQTSPKIELTRVSKDDKEFIWKPKTLLPQGKKLKIKIIDTKVDKILVEQMVSIAHEPRIVSKVKQSYFGKNDVAVVTFSQPIDRQSGKISFNLAGNGAWRDDTTYVFTPTTVAPGRTYSYTVPKGLRSKQGGVVTKVLRNYFSTPGTVQVVGMSPYGQELSSKRQVARFTFDQPVDHASAETRAHVSNATITGTSWNGNTLQLTLTGMEKQTTVRAWVDAGVRPVFGLASTQSFGLSFTTEIPSKHLSVPQYYQQYAQSCEASSTRMALAYKGVSIGSDMTILKEFGYDPHPYDKKKNIWDDPQQQFVGDVSGSQGLMTGWGVYAEPVAKAIRANGRGASVKYGVSSSWVATQIYAGNPVVLWGIWDESATQRSWKTPDGRKVTGPIPMHVRLVVGVKGKANNPVGFYIQDPITGPTYWTSDYLVYNAARAGGANQAVAVQ